MIQVRKLVKRFGLKTVLRGLDFEVQPGEFVALLGPNGAGKTTCLRIISGLLTPTSGTVHLSGFDVTRQREDAKRCLGYLTASTGLYQRLSPRELLKYFGQLLGMEANAVKQRIETLIDWLDMGEFADLRCGGLSTGQKQRTNIARALMGDPPILIMDEPTLGLDVLTNRIVLEFIRAEAATGKAVILSTHYLDDAESLCNRFGLIHEGRLVGEGDLASLQAKSGRRRLSEIFLNLCGQEAHVLKQRPNLPPSGTQHSRGMA